MKQRYESNDGVVRGAELKVISRTGRSTTLRRPISKLYPLECTDTAAVREHSNVLEPLFERRDISSRDLKQPTTKHPPRRRATIDGELVRRLVNSEELRGECDELSD